MGRFCSHPTSLPVRFRHAFHAAMLLCALLLAALGGGSAQAQSITVDPVSAREAAASSVTLNHIVGSGSNRLLMVSVAIEREIERVTSITYAGQALTFVGTSVDPTTSARIEVWRLIAPPSGANTVSVTFNGSASVVVAATSFANVDQTAPIAASQFANGTGTLTASASVASTTDQLVLAAIATDDAVNTVTPGSGQTSRWNVVNAADVIGAGSTKSGSASSTTMSYALGGNNGWAMGLVAIQPASTGVVTNTNDSGTGSLRAAIEWANLQTGTATVTFAIPGIGPHTINLMSALPNITANGVTINGASQSGAQCRDLWAGTGHDLRVTVRAASGFDGFKLAGANQTVRGLAMTGFANAVVSLPTSSNAQIQCNYLGLFADGASNGNTRGVLVQGASIRVGDLNAGDGNVISANAIAGVVTEQGSTDTAIRGNFIGTDPTGTNARANGTAINNFNGTATWRDITRNLISGNNGSAAIALETDDRVSPSDGTIRIQANIIGTNRAMTALLRNTGDGILFPALSITGVLIGGTASTEGNIITSQDDGIDLRSVTGVTIRGNTIGLAPARGISLDNVSSVTVGGTASTQSNAIGGNGTDGIGVRNNSSNVTITGNQIRPLATIGGTFANGGHGIVLENSTNVVIGDGTANGRNIIAGNGRRGIHGAGTNSGTTINGNYIGTDLAGNAAVANGQNEGVATSDAISFDGGGTVNNLAILNNVIGGYVGALVELWTSTTNGVIIQGNNIGVGANGVSQIVSGNAEDLIYMGGGTSHSNILIGGSGTGQSNIIAFSNRSGIRLESGGTNIQVIGNTIRNNSRNGIYVVGNTRAGIISNRIFDNGLIGIDLSENGVTLNDVGDGDIGANNLLNFPQIVSVRVLGSNQLQYNVTLDAQAVADGYRIEFFANSAADPTGYGEGERYLGYVDVTHAGSVQNYAGTLTTLAPVSVGDIVSATTTRRTVSRTWDMTSEFSANVTAEGTAQLAVTINSEVFDPPAGNHFATPGNHILLTTTVSNVGNGSTDADSIFAVIAINPNHAFLNDVLPGFSEAVGFSTSASTLTFTPGTDLRYSNGPSPPASLAQCTYTPASGYDSQVRYVCLNPKGTLPGGMANSQLNVRLRTRIN